MKGAFIGYKNFGISFFFSQFTRLTDRQTDWYFAHG